MAAEMTPRPEIDLTDEVVSDEIIARRQKHLDDCTASSYVFDGVIEAWRVYHRIRIGTRDQFVNDEEYEKALEDPDPYEREYVFYCLRKKLSHTLPE